MHAQRDALEQALAAELLGGSKPPTDARGVAALAAAVADRLRLGTRAPVDLVSAEPPPIARFDLRAEQDFRYPGGRRKVRMRGGRPVRRQPADVDAVVIHQMAAEFGVSASQVEAAGGDRLLAFARRGLDIACHAAAFREGCYALTHDLEIYVNHANRLNARSLGLEVDGRYPGVLDDPSTMAREDLRSTWGGPPTRLSRRTLEAARRALRELVTLGREAGMPIRYVYAHRQSSDTRRSDPGAELWQALVLDFAVPELGLETRPGETFGEGRPIPRQWDPVGAFADY